MGKNGETNKNIPWKWMLTIAGTVLFFILLFLMGIREGRQKREEENDYLEKLQAEQQMAKVGTSGENIEEEQTENERKENQDVSQEDFANLENETKTDRKEDTIRVLISVDGTEHYVHSEVRISCAGAYCVKGDFTVQEEAGTELCLSEQMQPGQTVWVEPTEATTPLTLESVRRNQGAPAYRGILEVTREEEGFRIINQVDLESYLKGVVPSEMPADAPVEALCAQAVCARTYAVRQIREQRMEEWNADVDDTVSCQVYNNIPEQETSNQAVDATRGMVMLCGGEPIEAYFFSTSWGYTDTDEVWDAKKSASYLKSVAVSHQAVEAMAAGNGTEEQTGTAKQTDMSETYFRELISQTEAGDYEKEDIWYRWKVSIPWEVLKERSERQYPQIGTFTGLAIQERNPGGGVKMLEIQADKQSVTLENEYAIRKFLSVKGLSIIRNDGSTCNTMELLPSACFVIDTGNEQGIDLLVFTGGGYGHGVGMSQNGAKHLAEDGMGWREILQVFYQNITIENLQDF